MPTFWLWLLNRKIVSKFCLPCVFVFFVVGKVWDCSNKKKKEGPRKIQKRESFSKLDFDNPWGIPIPAPGIPEHFFRILFRNSESKDTHENSGFAPCSGQEKFSRESFISYPDWILKFCRSLLGTCSRILGFRNNVKHFLPLNSASLRVQVTTLLKLPEEPHST